jgi:ComF family protein
MEFGILIHLMNSIKNSRIKPVIQQAKVAISSCNLCGNDTKSYPLLCEYCLDDLPKFNYQLVDNNLLNWPAINKGLPNHRFDHLYALSPHEWPYTQWISLLKYQGRFDLASLLGNLLYDRWTEDGIRYGEKRPESTVVVSVPLHPKKWQERGYNQAHLIAKHFAAHHHVTYSHNTVVRMKETDSQVGQTGAQRRKNIRGAFELNPNVELPEHVIIIDDVITTGTTVSEIATLLKTSGVEKVTVLTITIALPK